MWSTASTRRATAFMLIVLLIAVAAVAGLMLVLRPWTWGEGANANDAETAARAQEIENQLGSVQPIPDAPKARTSPSSRKAQPVGN